MAGFKIPPEMKGRYASILLQGIPVTEIKITEVNGEEVVGEYGDGAAIHINQSMIIAYWPDEARELKVRAARERAARKKKGKEENMTPGLTRAR